MTKNAGLEGCQAPFDAAQALAQVPNLLLLGRAQLPDRLGQPAGGLLPAPGHLIAGALPATDHVVEQALRPVAGPGRGIGRGGEGALDRRPQRVSDALRGWAAPLGARFVLLVGHRSILLGHVAAAIIVTPLPVPAHLRPFAPNAPDALLCGDPGRALAIAQRVLTAPRMSNHHRGLWGYHGWTRAGRELTVQATGIGGPSAAVVIGELIGLGTRRAVRIGTCAARGSSPPPGSGLVVVAAIAADGVSASLGLAPGSAIEPDRALTDELAERTGCERVAVFSHDFASGSDDRAADGAGGPDQRPPVEDLQTAATFAICARAGLPVAGLLAVASSAGRRLEDEPTESATLRLADGAVAALAATASTL